MKSDGAILIPYKSPSVLYRMGPPVAFSCLNKNWPNKLWFMLDITWYQSSNLETSIHGSSNGSQWFIHPKSSIIILNITAFPMEIPGDFFPCSIRFLAHLAHRSGCCARRWTPLHRKPAGLGPPVVEDRWYTMISVNWDEIYIYITAWDAKKHVYIFQW